MTLIKTCDLHRTVYYKVCRECLHEQSKAEKEALKAESKRKKVIEKAKLKAQEPRKKPKSVSEKQKVKNQEYSDRVKEWKKENPKCKANASPECTGVTDDCHHMKKRDNLLMVEKYWLPVCRPCHVWIGQNSDEARKKGLTINHLEPEFVEPHKI